MDLGVKPIQQCSTCGWPANSKRKPTLQDNPGFTKRNFEVGVRPVTLHIIQIHRQVLHHQRAKVVVVDEVNQKPKPAPVEVPALLVEFCKPRARAPAGSGVRIFLERFAASSDQCCPDVAAATVPCPFDCLSLQLKWVCLASAGSTIDMVDAQLPGADPEQLRKHGSPFPYDVSCMNLPKQANDCIRSLNQLAGAKFIDKQLPRRAPTKVQRILCNHVCTCIDENGAHPADHTGKQALAELTRSFCPYDGMPNHLADYCFDKVKILHSTVRSKKVVDLLPAEVRPFVTDFKHHVARDPLQVQAELESDPSAMPRCPYWGPLLQKDPFERMRLFKRMFDIGLLDLQPVVLAKAGIFCVKKKTPEYVRLIIDGRQANFMHRRPPVTRLGSSSCLSELTIPSGTDVDIPHARECDVSDCFYQFRIDEA